MLRPERAQELLKAYKLEDAVERRQARARALPGQLRGVAELLLTALRPPFDYARWHGERVRGAERLAGCTAPQRCQVFDAIFPGLANHVGLAWDLFARLPYQSDHVRRPFRSRSLVTGNSARSDWFLDLLRITQGYEQDVAWLAAWASYLGWGADALGIVFAAAIDRGSEDGERVFDILAASARGEHEIGVMGRHVTRALLVASRQEGWELLERLLLAAQGQEGLRQTILETVDEAHPLAFRRMLRLILEHGLARFSATVRALDVWLGFGWGVEHRREVDQTLRRLLELLEDRDARGRALQGEGGADLYLALWCEAFEDAPGAVGQAEEHLSDTNVQQRFAAAYLLAQIRLDTAQRALLKALDDEDMRVAALALSTLERGADNAVQTDAPFQRLTRLLERFPRTKTALPPLMWPWLSLFADRQRVAKALVNNLGNRSPNELIPYLPSMAAEERARVASLLATTPTFSLPALGARLLGRGHPEDRETRDTLLALVGDPSPSVRERALSAVAGYTASEKEAVQLEAMLARKAADLRRGVLKVLLNQQDGAALASARRLIRSASLEQRLAGLELLRELTTARRSAEVCRKEAEQYRAARAHMSDAEKTQLDGLLVPLVRPPSLEDALGLMDPSQRTTPRKPKAVPGVRLWTDATVACLASLDALIHEHRETPISVKRPLDGAVKDELLGNVRWLPWPDAKLSLESISASLPLRDVWERWWSERPAEQRDADGFELLRAAAALLAHRASWPVGQGSGSCQEHAGMPALRYPGQIEWIVRWLLSLRPARDPVDFLLDSMESQCAQVPGDLLAKAPDPNQPWGSEWRAGTRWTAWQNLARWHRSVLPPDWRDEHHIRLWRLLRWKDEPGTDVPRNRPELSEVVAAHQAGGATEADLFDQLLGPRPDSPYQRGFHDLKTLSGRNGSPLFEQSPRLRELVARCRERILEVELGRGDLPTAASAPALELRWSGGLAMLVRLLQAFGSGGFVRTWTWGDNGMGKGAVFSHLVQATFPAEADTPAAFSERVSAVQIPSRRLIELAMYAPQWAGHVEFTLGWQQLAEGVWWLHAHTKDRLWRVDQELREQWATEVAERTPLSAQQLMDGAVDVAWFRRVYAALGPERWKELDAAARYASGGGGHKRAQLFADAMRGRASRQDLLARVGQKRQPDAVRALGLPPLAEGEDRERDLLERYEAIQEFLRSSRQFGAQRQESEKLAAGIGLENLARTAGFPDPARLRWAMEAEAVADLAAGPITAVSGKLAVSLAIDEWGTPKINVVRQGKPLQVIPAQARKDPAVAALVSRSREIEQQTARMRTSLEEAMCRGDQFTGRELGELLQHPLLRPKLRSLIFIGEDASGYPVDGGTGLERHDGLITRLGQNDSVRIAHPHDLLGSGEWHRWQQDCFARERIQPYKQVFRELYVLTSAELAEGTQSRRYEGHQVNARRALALLGGRGWVAHPEEGVRRTFHAEQLTAYLTFFEGAYTPADVSGLTLESVAFTRRGEWKPLPLADLPPRVFSEAMRDLDLVVSVAHLGGVDPEASASTVEMRAALLRETCVLLGLDNVRIRDSHAIVRGELGDYSVHLGSGTVHRQPGGAVCIVPVHSQHRGRLFLPFADDDPKTAEVVSKTLLLARDRDIKDPTILEQMLAAPNP
jgi:hypothetical protein